MPLCRLSIHAEYDDAARTVDIALPSTISVHALLPTVVDLAGPANRRTGEPTRWHLGWVTGQPIDLALTLAENDVRDGDVLVLSPQTPPPLRHSEWDPCATVASAPDTRSTSPVAEILCGWALLTGTVALAWTGLTTERIVQLVIAAVAACMVMALAISAPHRSTLRIVAVTMCAVTGFLAVPSGPAAANVFLAAVAACSSVALLARWTNLWSPSLIAAGTFSTIVALSSAVPMVVSTPPAAIGAIVTLASLASLAVSARLATALAGLTPGGHIADVPDRAARGHAVLSGLVAGGACGAAAGSTLVFIAHLHDGADPLRRAAFTAVVGLALVLRARVHAVPTRCTALTAAGLICATVALAITADASAVLAPWCAAFVIAVGLVAAGRPGLVSSIGRGLDIIDYVALTAIIPLACWVGGLYALARGWHSP